MKRKNIILFIIIIISIYFIMFCFSDSLSLTKEFVGTYASDNNSRCFIAIAPQDNNAFYFTDQEHNLFIKGTFTKCTEGVYALSCDKTENKTIIVNQTISYKDSEFVVIINGCANNFKKINQTPGIINSLDYYS